MKIHTVSFEVLAEEHHRDAVFQAACDRKRRVGVVKCRTLEIGWLSTNVAAYLKEMWLCCSGRSVTGDGLSRDGRCGCAEEYWVRDPKRAGI